MEVELLIQFQYKWSINYYMLLRLKIDGGGSSNPCRKRNIYEQLYERSTKELL